MLIVYNIIYDCIFFSIKSSTQAVKLDVVHSSEDASVQVLCHQQTKRSVGNGMADKHIVHRGILHRQKTVVV